MVFDWADDVEASIESGDLPDFAPKDDVPKHDAAKPQGYEATIIPEAFRSIEEPKATIQRDPDWYNNRSWRTKEEPAPAVLARSTSATLVIDNHPESGQDDVLNAALNMVQPGSQAKSTASSADSISTVSQASTALNTPPIITTGEDFVKQEDPYFPNPFWNPEIKVRKVIIVSSDPNVNDIRPMLKKSTRPGEALDIKIQNPASWASMGDDMWYNPTRDRDVTQWIRLQLTKSVNSSKRECDEENAKQKPAKTPQPQGSGGSSKGI